MQQVGLTPQEPQRGWGQVSSLWPGQGFLILELNLKGRFVTVVRAEKMGRAFQVEGKYVQRSRSLREPEQSEAWEEVSYAPRVWYILDRGWNLRPEPTRF